MQVEQKLDVVIDALSNEAFMPYLQQYAQYTYEELLVLEREASERAIVLPAAFSRHLFTLKVTNRAGHIKWHDKSLSRFKQQIRILTNRNWGVSMKYQLFKISQYLRGWINYFGIANGYLKSQGLFSLRDGWIKLHYPK